MATSILLLTHNGIGDSLAATAERLMPSSSTRISVYAVSYDCVPENEVIGLKQYCAELDQGSGVLLLTDLYGATPSNIAMQFHGDANRWLVGGLNLAMLLKVLNYDYLEGEALARKAYEGGRDSVVRPW